MREKEIDDSNGGFSDDLVAGLMLRAKVDSLSEYKKSKTISALQAINWRSIWIIPCVAAAFILVFFISVFKDDSSANSISEGEIAEPEAREEGR